MLGPPVCKRCMRILDFKYTPDAKGHKYWRCNKCGVDPYLNSDGVGSLFLYSEGEQEKIRSNK